MRFLQNTGQDLCLPLIGLRLCAAFLQKRLRQGTRASVLTEKLVQSPGFRAHHNMNKAQ